MMRPEAVETILRHCEHRIARLQPANHNGFVEIQCSLSQGLHKLRFCYGDFQNFQIRPEELAIWKAAPLSRHCEPLATVEQVLSKLESALYDTYHLQQGFANIVIQHYGHNSRYGFQYCPSILFGIKPDLF